MSVAFKSVPFDIRKNILGFGVFVIEIQSRRNALWSAYGKEMVHKRVRADELTSALFTCHFFLSRL